MIGKTKEGWFIIEDDHSQWSHSDLIRAGKRIDIDLAGLKSQDFIRPYLLPGTVAIDIGAHLGIFTVPMMRALGRDGLVLAFEPDPELYLCLCRNIEKEQRDNAGKSAECLAYQGAAGHYSGEAIFRPNLENRGAGHLDFDIVLPFPGSDPEVVKLSALDDLQPVLENKVLSFIKIDCEGSEIDVIRGGRQLLRTYRPTLFVEVNPYAFAKRGVTQKILEEEIREFGYRFKFFPEDWNLPHDLLALPCEPKQE